MKKFDFLKEIKVRNALPANVIRDFNKNKSSQDGRIVLPE